MNNSSMNIHRIKTVSMDEPNQQPKTGCWVRTIVLTDLDGSKMTIHLFADQAHRLLTNEEQT